MESRTGRAIHRSEPASHSANPAEATRPRKPAASAATPSSSPMADDQNSLPMLDGGGRAGRPTTKAKTTRNPAAIPAAASGRRSRCRAPTRIRLTSRGKALDWMKGS